MTGTMITHPIHGDIMLDIDAISAKPEYGHELVNLRFLFRENIRHEIELDVKTTEKLVKALQYAMNEIKNKRFGGMTVIID